MTTHLLDERIMHAVLAHLIPSTMEHHNNYLCDNATWDDTHRYLLEWEVADECTTDYVYEEVTDLAEARRDTVRAYAREAMRLIHAMGEDRARRIAEGGTR
jgi:hypothetical protein